MSLKWPFLSSTQWSLIVDEASTLSQNSGDNSQGRCLITGPDSDMEYEDSNVSQSPKASLNGDILPMTTKDLDADFTPQGTTVSKKYQATLQTPLKLCVRYVHKLWLQMSLEQDRKDS